MPVYKDKTTGTYYCKCRYEDWRGVPKQHMRRGFEKRKDAIEYERDFLNKKSRQPTLSLNALAEDFLDGYVLRRKPNTIRQAEKNLNNHILPHLGNMQLDKITPAVIRDWQDMMLGSGLKDTSVKAVCNTFSTVMKFAVRYYSLQQNPFDKVDKIVCKSEKTVFLEDHEWAKLFSTIENKHDRALFGTLYWTGLRIGEMMALTEQDIDFASSTISVSKQYSSDSKTFGTTKNGLTRTVNVPPFAMDYIRCYFSSLLELPEYPFQLNTSRGLNWKLRKYCQDADVKVVSVHCLRHSHASYLIRQGFPINLVAQRLGHSSPVVTMRIYAHVYKDQDNDLANRLQAMQSAIQIENSIENNGIISVSKA